MANRVSMKDLLSMKTSSSGKKMQEYSCDRSSFGFPSGFTPDDAMNLNTFRGKDFESNIPSGDYGFTSVFGPSNSGKSCISVQKICSIIDYIKRTYGVISNLYMIDIEGHTNDLRIKQLSGWSDLQLYDHYEHVPGLRDPDDIYNYIRNFAFMVEKNPENFLMKTDALSLTADPVEIYVPTFFLIDSAAFIKSSKDFEVDKAGDYKEGQMFSNISGMHTARALKNLVLNLKEMCNQYNFHIHFIEHLKKEIYIDKYQKQNKYLAHLSNGEKLSTEETIYQSNKILQLTNGKKLDPNNDNFDTYGPKVRGFINKGTFVKSKHSREGLMYPMILNSNGFDPVLSDFEFLTEVKYGFTGVGTYYLDILPEVKITKKKLLEIVKDNPMVARAIQFTARSYLNCLYVQDREPIDLSQYRNLLDCDRYAMILNHTVDYPRYQNRGYTVDKKYIKESEKSKLNFGYVGSIFNSISKLIVDMRLRGYILEREEIGLNAVLYKTFDNDKSRVITTKKGKRYILK